MRIAGVIIAGGKSSRMGEEKALMRFGNRPLLSHVIARVATQVESVILNANGDAARFAPFGLTVVTDQHLDIGTPLAGLHAALRWAKDHRFDAALTVPSDAPFVPRDLAGRLAGEGASVAASGGQTHYLTGFWPAYLLEILEEALLHVRHSRESGNPALVDEGSGVPAFAGVTENGRMRRVQDWVRLCDARIIEWPVQPFDPFFNINTPDDLAEAERIAAEFAP
jgi:molybdenum cofactor guanylyltransferase